MKTVEEIYETLLADFEKRIGQNVSNSCDLAVRLYAVAAQIQALYIQTDWVEKQSFPQTATGNYLDYHAQMRGISRSRAEKATGSLRFSVREAAQSAVEIPVGTVCFNGIGMHYETVEAANIAPGSTYVDVAAAAMQAGSAGNTEANTILAMSVAPVSVISCSNPDAFTGGKDAEEDESLRARILDSYQRLPNGANAAFYEMQAMRHAGVVAAKAVGRARGVGTVDVYVAAVNGLPDGELLAQVQEELQAKREIAVDVKVLAPSARAVDVSLELKVSAQADFEKVKAAAEEAIGNYFNGNLLGKAVHLSQLYALLYGIEGVENYHILIPTEDVAAENTVLPVLGALSVTQFL